MKPTLLRRALGLCAASLLAACPAPPRPGPEPQAGALGQGYAYLAAGHYHQALPAFEAALKEARARGDAAGEAEAHGAFGYTLYLLPPRQAAKQQEASEEDIWRMAEKHLKDALGLASKAGDGRMEARVRGYLGLLYAKQVLPGQDTGGQAVKEFELSRELARENKDAALEYSAELQLARLRPSPAERLDGLEKLAARLPGAALADAARADLLVKIAGQLSQMGGECQARRSQARQDAHAAAARAAAQKAAQGLASAAADALDEAFGDELEGRAADADRAIDSAARGLEAQGQARAAGQLRLASAQCRRIEEGARRLGLPLAEKAAELADRAGLARLQAQAEIYLADWRSQNGEAGAAMDAALEAVRHAGLASPDLAMAAEAAWGRLLAGQRRTAQAVLAYQRAASSADRVRNEIPVAYPDGTSSYHTALEPVYRGRADTLLRAAAEARDPREKQALLREAVFSLENLKQSEMEDYFNDRCALDAYQNAAGESKAAKIATTVGGILDRRAAGETAILYPILLPDRLELLLANNGLIQQRTVRLTEERIGGQVAELRKELGKKLPKEGRDKDRQYEPFSKALHDAVLGPFPELASSRRTIKRLVYVPDGFLREVPLAAFFDGREFAVQHYATVTNSNLQFTTERQDKAGLGYVLPAGVGRPEDPLLDQLPDEFFAAALAKAKDPGCQIAASPADTQAWKDEVANQRAKRECRDQAIKALTLNNVGGELRGIASIEQLAPPDGTPKAQAPGAEESAPPRPLENQAFTSDTLKTALQAGGYQLLHIASHGYFGHSVKDSFIISSSEKLDVNQFQDILRPGQGKAINLLTLSACQTAQGDERAPLGFSGLAIKANAKNALGALWNVPDEATGQLMQAYYADLVAQQGDTAAALQQAQLAILSDTKGKGWRHPKYWAAFVLVGAW